MDIHQFFRGNAFDAHTYFGAHVTEQGIVFRTLAPNAAAVDLIWEGGDWEPIPMQRIHDGGELSFHSYRKPASPDRWGGDASRGINRITLAESRRRQVDHRDPEASGLGVGHLNNASIIRDLSSYTFHDKKWLADNHRKKNIIDHS